VSVTSADRTIVVLNPVASGLDRPAFAEALAAAFGNHALPEVFETPAGDDLPARVRSALESAARRGAELVVAAGGDGTVSLVADALLEAGLSDSLRMGIVPLGTANVLARELELPIDPAGAVAIAAASARTRALDAIRVDGRHYLTQVGTGLDAGMIQATSLEDRQARGRWAYWWAFWATMVGWRSARYDLTIDGRRYHKRAWQVVVANAATLGTRPFTWGPDIEPDDGVLDLCVYNVRSIREWIALAFRIVTRRHRPSPNARFFAVRDRVRIETRRPRPVQGDGEIIAKTPIEAVIARGVLRVVVAEPKPAPQADPADPAGAVGAAQAPTPASAPSTPSPAPGSGAPVAAVLGAGAVVDAGAAGGAVAIAPPPAPVPPAASRFTFLGRLGAIDTTLYFRVNRLAAWPPAERVASWLTRWMNSGDVWIGVAFALAIATGRTWMHVASFIAALWAASMLVNFPIKEAFRRRRPFLSNVDARVLGSRPADWSFPSGHSATAFAGAALLTPWAPFLAPLFFAYAALVGLSRVYLGVHYPGDVLIGGAIGMGIALAVRLALGLLGVPI
jgi:diacylglycerol kinase family enzyme/membrane-associated phospholipid phosphatase